MNSTPARSADGTPGDWVAVAVVMRPHGLRGTMRLKPLTRSAEELAEAPVRQFAVRSQQGRIIARLTAEELWVREGIVMANFEQVTDRTTAEQYTNMDLVIAESDLWELGEEEYYVNQLEGLEVRDAVTGQPLGIVRTAQEGAAHDYLVLRLDHVPGRDTLLPLIPQFVPRVSISEGRVEVVIPPGLVE
jgi:16S rRNA processing protein RimM